jgi:hypothetical protein
MLRTAVATVKRQTQQVGVLRKPGSAALISGRQFVIALSLALVGCAEPSGPPVRFEVPSGFRGAVQIVEARGGENVLRANGEYVYHIPTNGVLHVARALGLRAWHVERAFFSSGQQLPVEQTSEPERLPGEVVFYSLGTTQSRFMFFVGTHSEMLTHVKNLATTTEAARFWSGGSTTHLQYKGSEP